MSDQFENARSRGPVVRGRSQDGGRVALCVSRISGGRRGGTTMEYEPLYRILGDLEVLGRAGPLKLGGRRRRALLARLLVKPGVRVSIDAICEAVWGAHPPSGAVATVRTYVSQFRRLDVGGRSVLVEPDIDGYRLVVDRRDVDATRFEDQFAAAQKLDRPRGSSPGRRRRFGALARPRSCRVRRRRVALTEAHRLRHDPRSGCQATLRHLVGAGPSPGLPGRARSCGRPLAVGRAPRRSAGARPLPVR